MKNIVFLTLLSVLLCACMQKANHDYPPLSIVWEMGQNEIEPGMYENTFHIISHCEDSLKHNWTVYFNQMPAAVLNDKLSPVTVEQISSSFYKMYPSSSYQNLALGDTLRFTFRCKGSLLKLSGAPEGAYCVMENKNGTCSNPFNVNLKVIPFAKDYQWSRKGGNELPYPDGSYVYDENAIFSQKISIQKTDIFPSLKSVNLTGGEFPFTTHISVESDSLFKKEADLLITTLKDRYGCIIQDTANVIIKLKQLPVQINAVNDEYYQMHLDNGSIDIYGVTPHAIFNGIQSLLAFIHTDEMPYKLLNATIVDYPDLSYRGLMVDVARNFTTKENLLKLIDLLSMYKINKLHLHLTDDEGWRLEIPGLEELTTVGAKRGHTVNERDCLYPAYGSGWDANNKQSLGNGFYTCNDFVEILKYANIRHVQIIPEIDFPGHARAALKAMNARYYRYIDSDQNKAEEYLLTDFADTSRYVSAQSYTDNVVNVALPSVYKFIDKVVGEIQLMYQEAGVQLAVMHMGGDEVPHGTWEGSPISTAFMSKNGFHESRELKDYFIEQIVSLFKEKKIELGAWQEVGLLPDETVNKKFANSNVLSYCWNTIPDWGSDEIPYKLANSNYPVILSNVSNLYFDLAYSKHPDEPGLYWGGFVNEYNSFNTLPFNIYKSVRCDMSGNPLDIEQESNEKIALTQEAKKNIKGLQGQVWTETMRNFGMIEYALFPKMYGLIERAWNTSPKWAADPFGVDYKNALNLYNAKIGRRELSRLRFLETNFRIAQPGLKIVNGYLYANSSIPDVEIRYTLDESEPTNKSMLWKSPLVCKAKIIKAKAFFLGKESVTTILKNR